MEILYIYLHQYKNFKQQGFGFSSEFIFTTNVNDNKVSLTINKNPDFIPNFFENENVLNVTALIGQNGTGKSNILDFIKTARPGANGGFATEAIIVLRFKSDSSFSQTKFTYKILYTEGIELAINSNIEEFKNNIPDKLADIYTGDKYLTPKYKVSYSVENSMNEHPDIPTFLFYSNIFDLKVPSNYTISKLEGEEEITSVSDFYNISTMAVLQSDKEIFDNGNASNKDKIDTFKHRELIRNIDFIASDFLKKIEAEKKAIQIKSFLPLPEYLFITVINDDELALKGLGSYSKLFEDLDKFKEDFDSKKTPPKVYVINQFLRALFFNFLRHELILDNELFDQYLSTSNYSNFKDWLQAYVESIKKEGPWPSITNFHNHIYLKNVDIDIFIKFLETIVNSHTSKVSISGEAQIMIPQDSLLNPSNMIEFVNLYLNVRGISDFISLRWRSLSSGEQSLLTLISRFYGLTHGDVLKEHQRSLIIMIDEGDIYFHPEWQRKFLDIVLFYLPKIFPDKKIQFIITSNTPYIVSDLPSSNILYFKKDTDNLSTVFNGSEKSKKTFAANIHDLLANEFYVSSFLGEFALKKIEKIIKMLNSNKMEKFKSLEISNARKLINQIGEPIIRQRLEDMYVDRFGENVERLKEREKEIIEELKEIQTKLKAFPNND